MTGNNKNMRSMTEIEALDELLATYGADRTRWPAPARLRFASLIATDAEARRLLREAAALDRVLDLSTAPRAPSASLAGRIVAAAKADAGRADVRDIRLPARPAASSGAAARFRDRLPMPWPAAALMAASLLLGAFAGTAGVLTPAIGPLATADAGYAGFTLETDADASQLALGIDDADLFSEELL